MPSFFTPSVGLTNLPRLMKIIKSSKAKLNLGTDKRDTSKKRELSPELQKFKDGIHKSLNKTEASYVTAAYEKLRDSFDQSHLLKDIRTELEKLNSGSKEINIKKLISSAKAARLLIEKELTIPERDMGSDDILDASDNIEATGIFTNDLLSAFIEIESLIDDDGSFRQEALLKSKDQLEFNLSDEYDQTDYPQEAFYIDGLNLLQEQQILRKRALAA